MNSLKEEKSRVSKLRVQLEQASNRMEQEKTAWEQQKVGNFQFSLTTYLLTYVLGLLSNVLSCIWHSYAMIPSAGQCYHEAMQRSS